MVQGGEQEGVGDDVGDGAGTHASGDHVHLQWAHSNPLRNAAKY